MCRTKEKISRICSVYNFYISEKKSYISSSKSVLYPKTDLNILQVFNTNEFYSELRIFANKKYIPRKDFNENITPTVIMRINTKLKDILENKIYKSDVCNKYYLLFFFKLFLIIFSSLI